MTRRELIYVITDAPGRDRLKNLLRETLSPTALAALVAVPAWAVVAIPVGLLLGWHWLLIFGAVVVGSPVLVNLTDLLAARLGLPPLRWVASQILTPKENRNA
ncbi:hypothetical protein ACQEVF_59625 [Nonomuraea polychroma]|uniref:hypothetical protein n=1 Tax=Nonomuraea polychroma TaxID=46176 RepID=UPI003D90F25C